MVRCRRIFLILGLIGCAPQGREVEFRFAGGPSPGAFAGDTRAVTELCPVCRAPVSRAQPECLQPRDGHPCGERLRHPDRAACGFCRGTRVCAVCSAFAASGLCRYCGGAGTRAGATCFGCRGSGACQACGGTATCDACGGEGKIALPWSRPAPRAAARPAGKSFGSTRVEADEPLVWMEESIVLPALPEEGAIWTVSVASGGQRLGSERVVQKGRFAPHQPGSYIGVSGTRAVFFDVVGAEIRMNVQDEGGRPKELTASVDFTPPLQAKVGWEEIDSNGRAHPLETPKLPLPAGGFGEYRLRPVVELPGLPALRPRKEATYTYSSLSIRPVPEGRVRSGPPAPLVALSAPPLREGTEYQWTRTGGGQPAESFVSNRPSALIPFPAAGKYRLQVRAGGNVSPPVDLVAVRISLAGPEGRPLTEARLALLQKNAAPTDDWLAASPERFRIVVEDPSGEAPGSLSVFIREGEEGELQPPVSYTLSGTGERRETRPLALVADRADDAVPLGGLANGQPGDPTLYARPRSRIMVRYRGETVAVADVGPMIVHEIPVRFVAAGPGLPGVRELEAILKRRLEEASDVWAPYGRRFVLSSLEIAGDARNLLLVRGRRAGVDAHGRPSRAGMRFDQGEVSVPTPWSQEAGGTTPGATARAFASKLDAAYTAEVFEGLIPSDREAVVLRVCRRDGRPVVLSPLAEGQDIAQSFGLLTGDLSSGCEVTTDRKLLTLEELMLLLGLRLGPPEGIDLFVVQSLRSDALEPAQYKIYPDESFPAPLSGAAVVAWEVADGSGRYPYALARVVGELLLPPGWRPRPEDSLFSGELSARSAPDANKRVGPATGARIRERGRGQAIKNDDITRGNQQGGK